jgi:hypothetical protein
MKLLNPYQNKWVFTVTLTPAKHAYKINKNWAKTGALINTAKKKSKAPHMLTLHTKHVHQT